MKLNDYLSIWASIASIATMSVAITALVIATDVLATINRPDVRFEGPKIEVPSIELRWAEGYVAPGDVETTLIEFIRMASFDGIESGNPPTVMFALPKPGLRAIFLERNAENYDYFQLSVGLEHKFLLDDYLEKNRLLAGHLDGEWQDWIRSNYGEMIPWHVIPIALGRSLSRFDSLESVLRRLRSLGDQSSSEPTQFELAVSQDSGVVYLSSRKRDIRRIGSRLNIGDAARQEAIEAFNGYQVMTSATLVVWNEGNLAIEGVSLESLCDVSWSLEGPVESSNFSVAPASRESGIVLTAALVNDEIVRNAECILTDTTLKVPPVEARKGIDITKVVLWLTGSLGVTAAAVFIPYLVIGVRGRRRAEP